MVKDLIEHWLLCHEIFLTDAPHLKRLCIVRYEEFVAEPQATLDRLYAFLDLPPHPVGEEITSEINDSYLSQWRAISEHPSGRQQIEQAMECEPRVRALGYSLMDWSVSNFS
jgi:hypothetical protein